jgi:hypothetical protein
MAIHNQACVVVWDEDEVGLMQSVFIGSLTWHFSPQCHMEVSICFSVYASCAASYNEGRSKSWARLAPVG